MFVKTGACVIVLHADQLYTCTTFVFAGVAQAVPDVRDHRRPFLSFVLEPDREGVVWVHGQNVNAPEALAMKAASAL